MATWLKERVPSVEIKPSDWSRKEKPSHDSLFPTSDWRDQFPDHRMNHFLIKAKDRYPFWIHFIQQFTPQFTLTNCSMFSNHYPRTVYRNRMSGTVFIRQKRTVKIAKFLGESNAKFLSGSLNSKKHQFEHLLFNTNVVFALFTALTLPISSPKYILPILLSVASN